MAKHTETTASDLIVKCLENEGVKYVFGVPGEENAHFMIALEKSKQIQFILCRHEQGAAFMADAYGRITGIPAVTLATLGPGATNLVTGISDANMDRVPVVVITGQAGTARIHKESHQVMDVIGMFKPITKWNQAIYNVQAIPEIVRKAFKIATTEKPGASHIELPEDIAAIPLSLSDFNIYPVKKLRRPVPDEKIIGEAYNLLKQSKCPIILAGNGTIRKRASKQLRSFVELTNIPVISTFMAKGAISSEAPQSFFTIGLQSRDWPVTAIEKADLVICIGYDLVEYHPHLWNKKSDKKIIHIDFIPAEVDEHYNVEVEIVGDLAHTLWMFNELVQKEPLKFTSLQQLSYVRENMLKDFAEYANDDTVGYIRPQKVLHDVRKFLGAEDILISDVGAHKMWIARYYQCVEPNTCLISNGFCSMGFALPGALGASLAKPEAKILAICGDGGFLMNVQEMECFVRLGIKNVVVMVWVDGGYGLISWKQSNQFDGHHTNLSFGNPDFVKLAESFGWNGYQVNSSKDLIPTLEKAFAAQHPALIAIPIDYRENPLLTKKLGQILVSI